MKAVRNRLTRTIFVIPVLVILSSSFCLCLTPTASAMSVGMSCGSMEEGSRLLEDSGSPICVKAAKVSIGDLTAPPKLIHAGKLLPQALTAQTALVNLESHPFSLYDFSTTSYRKYPTVEIFTLNATYRL